MPRADFTVSVALFLTPPAAAVIVAVVDVDTAPATSTNVALVFPAGTIMDAGAVTAMELLDTSTATPSSGAAELKVTVALACCPPETDVGLIDKAVTFTGGWMDRLAVRVTPPAAAVMVAVTEAVTATV